MDHGARQRQEIPTHLEVEDRLFFGLTLRQGIVVLVGLSIGYFVYAQIGNLPWPADGAATTSGGHPAIALRITVALLPALCSLVLAVVQPAGRPLEEWLFALARYATLPKRCVWRPRAGVGASIKTSTRWIAGEQVDNAGGAGLDGDAPDVGAGTTPARSAPLADAQMLSREVPGEDLGDLLAPAPAWEGADEP